MSDDGAEEEVALGGQTSPMRVRRRWSVDEDEMLRKAVDLYGEGNWVAIANDVADRNPQQCLHRWVYNINPNIKKGPWTSEEDQRLVDLVNGLGQEWTEIARQMAGRTGGQCLSRWRTYLDPTLKKGEWTDAEDTLLVEQRDLGRTWTEIAKMLTGRCDADVRDRYQFICKPKTPRKGTPAKWTAEEDDALRRVVYEHGESNWEAIASQMVDRTVYQCYRRWHEGFNPNIKKGSWTVEEDLRLTELVNESGTKWALISKTMEGRTANQCRQRWSYCLNPTLKKGKWEEEEDAFILDGRDVKELPWIEIAKGLPGRCSMDVRDRYSSLLKGKGKKRDRDSMGMDMSMDAIAEDEVEASSAKRQTRSAQLYEAAGNATNPSVAVEDQEALLRKAADSESEDEKA